MKCSNTVPKKIDHRFQNVKKGQQTVRLTNIKQVVNPAKGSQSRALSFNTSKCLEIAILLLSLSHQNCIFSQWGQSTSGTSCSRLDITERSFLNQSTSVVSVDEIDGFDDFESDMSSSEEVTTIPGTHSQSQKKSIKTGKSWKTLLTVYFSI